MSPEPPRQRKRGTPISDSLGADLQTLGGILANHTRGLDDYLMRQAQRIEERHQNLLADAPGFLLPPDLNLEGMTKGELQTLCRKRRLRGWSKLRRDDLLAFVKQELGPELKAMQILQQEQTETAPGSHFDGSSPQADASRTERLLLLVLRHLDVAADEVEAAWRGPNEQA
jgi:hypothetical protein